MPAGIVGPLVLPEVTGFKEKVYCDCKQFTRK